VLMLLKMAAGRQGRTEAGVCFFATVLKTSTAKGRAGDGRNRRVWRTRKRGNKGRRSGTGNKCQFMGKACLLAHWLRPSGACTPCMHSGQQPHAWIGNLPVQELRMLMLRETEREENQEQQSRLYDTSLTLSLIPLASDNSSDHNRRP
jgi:hypothetical protein